MDRYFYLIAQLPTLSFVAVQSLSFDDFLTEARKWLPPDAYARLAMQDSAAVLPDYERFERDLRADLYHFRLARRSGQTYSPQCFPATLFQSGTPLEIEKQLLKLRWDYLETLAVDHHFDLDAVLLYGLKLQLINRLAVFDADSGMETFQPLCRTGIE